MSLMPNTGRRVTAPGPRDGGTPRWTRDQWLLFVLFVVCLQPYSISIGGVGVSVNYLFVFIPLVMAMAGSPRPLVIRWELISALLFFGVIYAAGLRFDVAALDAGAEPAFRRLASFAAFMLPFSLAFVRFRPADLDVFKMAVVAAAVHYSFLSVLNAVPLLATTPVVQLKAMIGSQRYGFVLCLAFFIVLYAHQLIFRRARHVERFALGALIVAGLGLTFSRASLVACAAGIVVAAAAAGWGVLVRVSARRRPGRLRSASTFVALATLGLVLLGLVAAQPGAVAGVWGFYVVGFVDPSSELPLMSRLLEADVATSEGYRAYMWIKVLEYLGTHPLMGSSFQGVYLMFEEFRGAHSAHGQYLDVLARTGLLGFAVWSVLLARIVWWCRTDPGLLAGVSSILVFGLFHETFKLSQGGFIFAMLLSFAYLPTPGWHAPAAPVAGR